MTGQFFKNKKILPGSKIHLNVMCDFRSIIMTDILK